MDYLNTQAEIAILKAKNSYLFIYAITISLACLLFAVIALNHDEHTIVVPPSVKESFWISDHNVSESYLTQMTEFLLGLALNKTPGNARYQTNILLKYVDPSVFNRLKQKMSVDDDKAIKENISTTFFPVKDKVWIDAMKVEVTGDFMSRLGDKVNPSQRTTYVIHYNYRHGHLHVWKFYQKKADRS